MSKFFHIIAPIIAAMDVAPSPPIPTTLSPSEFEMLEPPQYYQKILYKFDLATDLVFTLRSRIAGGLQISGGVRNFCKI